MRLVPVLFPSDLGWLEEGEKYVPGGERDAPDLLLDMLEGERIRLARPQLVSVRYPEGPDKKEAEKLVATAVQSLAEVVASVNAAGNFPLVLGGDHTGMCGHVLGHAAHDDIGLAVLADAYLDMHTENADPQSMALAGSLRMLPGDSELGRVMAGSTVQLSQTSVVGFRGERGGLAANEKKVPAVELWPMERLELDGESAYRSMLNRHLAQGPIVLSVDVSGLDPHLMTAVRRPVPDGLDWSFLKRTLEQCVPHVDRILGLDICQLEPKSDDVHHKATSRLAETLGSFLRRLTR